MRPANIHAGAWRYPGAYPDANFNFNHMKNFAQKLEKGKFDAFFMADHLALLNMPMDALRRSSTVTSFEPITLLSALASVTENIGLVATGSTTYDEPFHVARRFASLTFLESECFCLSLHSKAQPGTPPISPASASPAGARRNASLNPFSLRYLATAFSHRVPLAFEGFDIRHPVVQLLIPLLPRELLSGASYMKRVCLL